MHELQNGSPSPFHTTFSIFPAYVLEKKSIIISILYLATLVSRISVRTQIRVQGGILLKMLKRVQEDENWPFLVLFIIRDTLFPL